MLPAIAVVDKTALGQVPLMFDGFATCNPLGKLSLKVTLLIPGFPAGLVIVKVSVVA